MERPIFKPIGTSTEELDTPSLIVDVDSLEHNIATVAGSSRTAPPSSDRTSSRTGRQPSRTSSW